MLKVPKMFILAYYFFFQNKCKINYFVVWRIPCANLYGKHNCTKEFDLKIQIE